MPSCELTCHSWPVRPSTQRSVTNGGLPRRGRASEMPPEAFEEADLAPEDELADPVPRFSAGPGSTTVPNASRVWPAARESPKTGVRERAAQKQPRASTEQPLAHEVRAADAPPSAHTASADPRSDPYASGPRSVGRCFGFGATRDETSTTRGSASEPVGASATAPGVTPWGSSATAPATASQGVAQYSARLGRARAQDVVRSY